MIAVLSLRPMHREMCDGCPSPWGPRMGTRVTADPSTTACTTVLHPQVSDKTAVSPKGEGCCIWTFAGSFLPASPVLRCTYAGSTTCQAWGSLIYGWAGSYEPKAAVTFGANDTEAATWGRRQRPRALPLCARVFPLRGPRVVVHVIHSPIVLSLFWRRKKRTAC